MTTQTVERRTSSLKTFETLTNVEIIYEPGLHKERDQMTYYDSSEEIVIKKGCFLFSLIISALPEEDKEQLKSLLNNLADLFI